MSRGKIRSKISLLFFFNFNYLILHLINCNWNKLYSRFTVFFFQFKIWTKMHVFYIHSTSFLDFQFTCLYKSNITICLYLTWVSVNQFRGPLIYLSTNLPVHQFLSKNLPVHQFTCSSIFVYQFLFTNLCLPIYLSTNIPVHQYTCQPDY